MTNEKIAMLAQEVYQLAAKSTQERHIATTGKARRAFQILTRAALDLGDLARDGDRTEGEAALYCLKGCGNLATHFEPVPGEEKHAYCDEHRNPHLAKGGAR